MRMFLLLSLLTAVLSANAQTADVIYKRACGAKGVSFDVQHIKGQASTAPEPHKALVYLVEDESGWHFTTRVGRLWCLGGSRQG